MDKESQSESHGTNPIQQILQVVLLEKKQQIKNKEEFQTDKRIESQITIDQVSHQQRVFSKICSYLTLKKIDFKVMQHQQTRTSEQSALIRKTPLEWGSKTMLVTGIESRLVLLIYRANRKVSWKKIRKIAQIGKKSQMATEKEVISLGVKPGGVPPFSHMIGVKGILDSKFKQVQMMAFNAGHKCKSIVMKTADFPLEDIVISDITEQ